jgi:NADH:ubiquinone oxidoreductase subunit 3 (subunit A)
MKIKPYKKKGQTNMAVSSIITLVVGVGVAVMVLIFVGSLGGQTYNITENDLLEVGNQTQANTTLTVYNNTAVSLGHHNVHLNSLFVYNASQPVGLANFTVNYDAGTILALTGDGANYNNTLMTVEYTWGNLDLQNSIKEGITSSFGALEQVGDYLPLIVLAVIVSLVLVLVLGFTAFGGGGRGTAL